MQIVARSPDRDAPDRDVRHPDGDDIAGTAAFEHRTRAPGQYQATLDPDRALVYTRRKLDDVAVLRQVHHSLQRLLWNSLQRLRTGEA